MTKVIESQVLSMVDIEQRQEPITMAEDKTRPRFVFDRSWDLFAVTADDGSTQYWPKQNQATAKERSEGRYVEDGAISQTVSLGPANAMRNDAPRFDVKHNRKVFAVITKAGETRYVPRESEATDEERAQGFYIPDDVVDKHEGQRRRTALKDDSADRALRRIQREDRFVSRTNITPLRPPRQTATKAKEGHIVIGWVYTSIRKRGKNDGHL